MLLSMTGFARKSKNYVWGTLTLEISSVNHRYQELTVRLPREFASLEPAATARLRSAAGRGKVRMNVEVVRNPEYKMAVIDEKLLVGYWRKLNEIAREIEGEQKILLTSLLSMPGVSESPRDGELESDVEAGIYELMDEAAKALAEMKTAEGASLAKDILSQVEAFSEIVEKVSSEWQDAIPDALAAVRARLEKFLGEAGQGASVEPSRLAQEIALLSDKWDIAEEITRSRSHIEKFRAIIGDAKPSEGVGRKLDFMVQEMNREINTMGSKMQNAPLRWQVVEAKAYLERVREQIQNVE